ASSRRPDDTVPKRDAGANRPTDLGAIRGRTVVSDGAVETGQVRSRVDAANAVADDQTVPHVQAGTLAVGKVVGGLKSPIAVAVQMKIHKAVTSVVLVDQHTVIAPFALHVFQRHKITVPELKTRSPSIQVATIKNTATGIGRADDPYIGIGGTAVSSGHQDV